MLKAAPRDAHGICYICYMILAPLENAYDLYCTKMRIIVESRKHNNFFGFAQPTAASSSSYTSSIVVEWQKMRNKFEID